MAGPTVTAGEHAPGALPPAPQALPLAPTPDSPPRHNRVAEPSFEEPDAGNLHVRICGGPGKATSRAYPTVPGESGHRPARRLAVRVLARWTTHMNLEGRPSCAYRARVTQIGDTPPVAIDQL